MRTRYTITIAAAALIVGFLCGRTESHKARVAPRSEHWSGPILVRETIRGQTAYTFELHPFRLVIDGKVIELSPQPIPEAEGGPHKYFVSFPEAGVELTATGPDSAATLASRTTPPASPDR